MLDVLVRLEDDFFIVDSVLVLPKTFWPERFFHLLCGVSSSLTARESSNNPARVCPCRVVAAALLGLDLAVLDLEFPLLLFEFLC